MLAPLCVLGLLEMHAVHVKDLNTMFQGILKKYISGLEKKNRVVTPPGYPDLEH